MRSARSGRRQGARRGRGGELRGAQIRHPSAMHSVPQAPCPDLTFVKPRFDAYRAVSLQIRAIFADYAAGEPLSLDAAYSTSPRTSGGSRRHADRAEIRARIVAETGLPLQPASPQQLSPTRVRPQSPTPVRGPRQGRASSPRSRAALPRLGPRRRRRWRLGIATGADLKARASPLTTISAERRYITISPAGYATAGHPTGLTSDRRRGTLREDLATRRRSSPSSTTAAPSGVARGKEIAGDGDAQSVPGLQSSLGPGASSARSPAARNSWRSAARCCVP